MISAGAAILPARANAWTRRGGPNKTAAQTILVTSGGVDIMILVPYGARFPIPFIFYHSGVNESRDALLTDGLKTTCVNAFQNAGYLLAGISPGNNWGNQFQLNAYVTAYNYIASQYSLGKTVIWSQSMGGCAGLLNLSANAYPNLRGWLGTYPVCSLSNLYGGGSSQFATQINTAYGITNPPTYATQTAGHDPILLPASTYPFFMRFYSSPGDTVVNKAANSDAMSSYVAGIAAENTVVTTSGDHGDPSNFQPADYVAFVQRAIA